MTAIIRSNQPVRSFEEERPDIVEFLEETMRHDQCCDCSRCRIRDHRNPKLGLLILAGFALFEVTIAACAIKYFFF